MFAPLAMSANHPATLQDGSTSHSSTNLDVSLPPLKYFARGDLVFGCAQTVVER